MSAGVPVRTGYVEAVATAPAWQGRGIGTLVMQAIGELIRDGFALGALGTGAFRFYRLLGWQNWRGPTFVREPAGMRRTPDDDGFIMVLVTPTTPTLISTRPSVATGARVTSGEAAGLGCGRVCSRCAAAGRPDHDGRDRAVLDTCSRSDDAGGRGRPGVSRWVTHHRPTCSSGWTASPWSSRASTAVLHSRTAMSTDGDRARSECARASRSRSSRSSRVLSLR